MRRSKVEELRRLWAKMLKDSPNKFRTPIIRDEPVLRNALRGRDPKFILVDEQVQELLDNVEARLENGEVVLQKKVKP